MSMDFAQYLPHISRLCAELRVERLEAFGSAVRDDFHAGSDIDLLVRFADSQPGVGRRFIDLHDRLEVILGRPVDLVSEPGIRNPFFRAAIEAERHALYAA